jgi:hypothetical protein
MEPEALVTEIPEPAVIVAAVYPFELLPIGICPTADGEETAVF